MKCLHHLCLKCACDIYFKSSKIKNNKLSRKNQDNKNTSIALLCDICLEMTDL
jgi:hypothetical protein